jgi:PhzF family phenazine biosynthesis protein
MRIPIFQVDAFTDIPFKGNPAAVCLLSEPAPEEWMQNVAMEMNLSETAFLLRGQDGYALRWFTPKTEVALCGHATLASAHVLWEAGELAPGDIARFHTASGLLTARRMDDGIELNFPATPPSPAALPAGLAEALGVTAKYAGLSRFDYLIAVDEEETVRALKPDFPALRALPVRGVMVTARAMTPGYDFVSRFFAPGAGVDEDPVTGSAHCCLAPYWSQQLGKMEMSAYQASARGGSIRLRLDGDRVYLAGRATTILRGELYISFPPAGTYSAPTIG